MLTRALDRRLLVARGRHFCTATLAICLAIPVSVFAQPDTEASSVSGLSLELEGGLEYDSLVSLDELDLSRNVADTALIFNTTMGYSTALSDKTELDFSYGYNILKYQDSSEVDQNSHVLSADLTRDIGKARLGLSGFYVNSDLDGESFLELGRVSPHISGFFAKGWFARAGFVYSDKTNSLNGERDATASIGEVDIYHFPAGKPWFLNVGYKYRDEDASAARFDYNGDTLKARYVYRLTLLARQARFELGFRRLNRDYTALTPSIGAERFDQRDRTQAKLELAATPRLDLELYYTYSDWESNLETVDFSQNVAGLRFRYAIGQ